MMWQPGQPQQEPSPQPPYLPYPPAPYPPQGPQAPYPPQSPQASQGAQQPYSPQGQQQPPSGRPNPAHGQQTWLNQPQPQNTPQPWQNGPSAGVPYPQPWQNPPQPGAPYPSAPGPQRRHRAPGRTGNKLKWLVPGAAVVVAAIVAAAFALTSGGHSSAGTAGGGTGKPVPKWQALGAQNYAIATWTYKNSLVAAANTEITAYSQTTGAVLWRTPAPVVQKFNTMFCGGSPSASGSMAVVGLGVVTDATGMDSDCHSITSLNLATGKLGWVDALPSNAEQVTYGESLEGHPSLAHHGLLVEVSGQTVVAGWLGVLAGYSLKTGAREWLNVIGGDQNFDGYVTKDIAISGSTTYAVLEQLFPSAMQLLRIDTATGKVDRKVAISKSMTGLASPLVASIGSAAPLTVAFGQVSPTDDTSVVGFTASLTAGWVLHAEPRHSGDPEYLAGPAVGSNVDAHQFSPLLLGNGLFAVVTVSASDGAGNTLVAFDATTGAKKWTATVPGAEFWAPVAVTGGVVQAVAISDEGRANPMFVSLDAATGKVVTTGQPRVLGPAPLGQANAFYRYVLSGEHMYGINWGISKAAQGALPAVFSLN